ncbi:MAG: LysR family transcriptional regulator [Hyphomonadaceae bacterium]
MSGERFDWDKMRVFSVVADLGSMSAAATRLGESPPTISRKIDSLEDALGSELFVRSTRGVTLTPAGRIALGHAKTMSDAADALYTDASDIDKELEGPVTLITGDGLAAHWIAPRLPSFHQKEPKIELNVLTSDATPDLLGGDGDIAIQFSEPTQSDLISRRLGVLHYMCFASDAYLRTYGSPDSIFEMVNHRCLTHSGYIHQIDRWAAKASEIRKILDMSLVTNSSTVLEKVVANGGGITVLPSYYCGADPRLVALDLPEVAPVQFWLTYTERVRRLPRGEAVIKWIRSIFDPSKIVWFREKFVHPNKLHEDEFAKFANYQAPQWFNELANKEIA